MPLGFEINKHWIDIFLELLVKAVPSYKFLDGHLFIKIWNRPDFKIEKKLTMKFVEIVKLTKLFYNTPTG